MRNYNTKITHIQTLNQTVEKKYQIKNGNDDGPIASAAAAARFHHNHRRINFLIKSTQQ